MRSRESIPLSPQEGDPRFGVEIKETEGTIYCPTCGNPARITEKGGGIEEAFCEKCKKSVIDQKGKQE